MAGETYYFFFSLILALTSILHLVNLLFLRAKGKTIYGQAYKPDTPEYKRVIRLASSRNMAITVCIALIFIVNLVYEVNRLMHFDDREYAHHLLIYAPIATVLFFILMFFIMRKRLERYFPGK